MLRNCHRGNNMTNQQQQIQQILDFTKIAKKKLGVGREV